MSASLAPDEKKDGDVRPTPPGQPATEAEIEQLFKVADRVPPAVWVAALVAGAERFAWYGATGPFQNYLQNDRHSALPGALGLRQDVATLVMAGFFAASYFTPVLGALMADAWIGRYHTLVLSSITILVGSIVLFVTSLPSIIQLQHTAAAGLVVAMALYALGSGCLRAAISPFIADQYTNTEPLIHIRKDGERCVTDREVTIQYIYNMYYWVINIAGLAALATTFLEKYVGFWAAFLLPMIGIAVGLAALVVYHQGFVRETPSGTVIPQAASALVAAARAGFHMDAAKPEAQLHTRNRQVNWDDTFIDQLKLALFACRVLLVFPIHWLCLNQTFNNLISQAGQMQSSGVPNDAIKSINPLSSIIIYPFIQKGLYPYLRRKGIPFTPISRIVAGFILLAGAMAYAAGIQHLIYSTGPCYDAPRACAASAGGTLPNHVNVFVQTPSYILDGLAEVFSLPAAQEIAYNQAPRGMRSITSAISIAMAGIGALLAIAFTPLARDPLLVIMYAVLAGLMGLATLVFWFVFRRVDGEMLRIIE